MIPKIIHYCWFGRNKLPINVKESIESWHKYMPDFEIIEWNEDNFNINLMKYTRQAYFAGKYAFVSDVARLYALTMIGGIYLDTDVILKKKLPLEWLSYKAFTSFEHNVYVQTGVLASEPHHPIFEEFYKSYFDRSFFKGLQYDFTTNVFYMTQIMKKYGFVMNNKMQIRDGFVLFPQVILSAKDWQNGRYDTEETIALHDFAASWGKGYYNNRIRFFANMVFTVVRWYIMGILNK